MDAIWERVAELVRTGERVATATIVEARGSTPREAGATMLVREGRVVGGTIGGGVGEARVIEEAARALEDGTSRTCVLDLIGDAGDPDASLCGGVVEVFVDCLERDRRRTAGLGDLETVEAIRTAQEAGHRIALAVIVSDPRGTIPVGARWLADADGTLRGPVPPQLERPLHDAVAAALEAGRSQRVRLCDGAQGDDPRGLGVFVHVIEPRPQLIVVGAGHIAVPLVRMAKLVDFRVTVVDDRPSFVSAERFPDADRLVVAGVDDFLRAVPIGPSTSLVLVTRSHEQDEAALEAVVDAEPAYVGMIGSRRKVREVFRQLVARGVSEERLARVHAPIGLAIGARTPAEIAVAIIAEIVQVRRGPSHPARERAVDASASR